MKILEAAARKAGDTLQCQQLCSLLLSISRGGLALDIASETHERISVRIDELAAFFDEGEQSHLICASVMLPMGNYYVCAY